MRNVIFILCCSFLLQSCVGDEPGDIQTFPQVQANLQLDTTTDNVPADNYTYATVSATTALHTNVSVVFATDKGVFSNGETTFTAVAMPNETVNAYLRYNKAGIARVTATLATQGSKEAFVTFLPAYPNSILVNPAVSTLPAALTSTTQINTKLLRVNGTVSENMVVTYRDSIGVVGGGSIGTFLNTTLADAQGNATAQYWLQETNFHGFVYIIAEVKNDAGTVMAKGKNRIYIPN